MQTHLLKVKKIKKLCDPYNDKVLGYRVLKKKMVTSALESSQFEVDAVPPSVNILRHAKRVAYFVANGYDKPIVINTGIEFVKPVVSDGVHKLAAAIYIGREYIDCIVCGPVDSLDQLKE